MRERLEPQKKEYISLKAEELVRTKTERTNKRLNEKKKTKKWTPLNPIKTNSNIVLIIKII